MKRQWIIHAFVLVAAISTLFSCTSGSGTSPTPSSSTSAPQTASSPLSPTAQRESPSDPTAGSSGVERPYWPTDGWLTSSPEAQNMDSAKLAAVSDAIREHDYRIDSVTIIRHGYMVADEYFPPFSQGEKHIIHSCTKSIVSALIGIAMDQGYIESVDQPVLELFSRPQVANLDADKQSMTLEHLLTMTAGFDARDSYLYGWEGLYQMRRTDDWVQYMLDLPMAQPPGTRFEYTNGVSFLLSALIHEKTGVTTLAFAQENLFAPLGISDVDWPANPQGIQIGWGELRMIPHDMAKIGVLYLNHGSWDGEQILPEEWVRASTTRHVDAATLSDGYGYQWWVDSEGFYMALGYAGQFIYVIPGKDLVVVFTSDLPEDQFFVPEELLKEYIIPSAR